MNFLANPLTLNLQDSIKSEEPSTPQRVPRRKRAQSTYTNISDEIREELVKRITVNKEKIIDVAKSMKLNYSTAKSILRVFRYQKRVQKVPQKLRIKRKKHVFILPKVETQSQLNSPLSADTKSSTPKSANLSSPIANNLQALGLENKKFNVFNFNMKTEATTQEPMLYRQNLQPANLSFMSLVQQPQQQISSLPLLAQSYQPNLNALALQQNVMNLGYLNQRPQESLLSAGTGNNVFLTNQLLVEQAKKLSLERLVGSYANTVRSNYSVFNNLFQPTQAINPFSLARNF